MSGAKETETELFLRRRLECCYDQGDLKEAIRLGREMDQMQCQLLRHAQEPVKAAG